MIFNVFVICILHCLSNSEATIMVTSEIMQRINQTDSGPVEFQCDYKTLSNVEYRASTVLMTD